MQIHLSNSPARGPQIFCRDLAWGHSLIAANTIHGAIERDPGLVERLRMAASGRAWVDLASGSYYPTAVKDLAQRVGICSYLGIDQLANPERDDCELAGMKFKYLRMDLCDGLKTLASDSVGVLTAFGLEVAGAYGGSGFIKGYIDQVLAEIKRVLSPQSVIILDKLAQDALRIYSPFHKNDLFIHRPDLQSSVVRGGSAGPEQPARILGCPIFFYGVKEKI